MIKFTTLSLPSSRLPKTTTNQKKIVSTLTSKKNKYPFVSNKNNQGIHHVVKYNMPTHWNKGRL